MGGCGTVRVLWEELDQGIYWVILYDMGGVGAPETSVYGSLSSADSAWPARGRGRSTRLCPPGRSGTPRPVPGPGYSDCRGGPVSPAAVVGGPRDRVKNKVSSDIGCGQPAAAACANEMA